MHGQSYSSSIMPPDSSQQQYSRLAGKMISMVNELRATGADVALELPTIVVCGQQSAGKSSVVEVSESCQKQAANRASFSSSRAGVINSIWVHLPSLGFLQARHALHQQLM
jgi:hypothetical protein